MYAGPCAALQGQAIPGYYGLYESTVEGEPFIFLLLQDCGDPLNTFFHLLDVELKYTSIHTALYSANSGVGSRF